VLTPADLNFADPPIAADWPVFQPRVSPHRAGETLGQAAAAMRSNEVLAAAFEGQENLVEEAAQAVDAPSATDAYASGIPMIARFLTIELDTKHKIAKGIGRMAKPPRFGDKYRKVLRDPDVAEEVESVIERLALHGFAGGVAMNAMRDEPSTLVARDISERWSLLVRSLTPTSYAIADLLNIDESTASPMPFLFFGVVQPAADDYALLAERLRLGRGRPFGAVRAASYMPFFLALGAMLFDTATNRATGE
jgi:hypothetical protein